MPHRFGHCFQFVRSTDLRLLVHKELRHCFHSPHEYLPSLPERSSLSRSALDATIISNHSVFSLRSHWTILRDPSRSLQKACSGTGELIIGSLEFLKYLNDNNCYWSKIGHLPVRASVVGKLLNNTSTNKNPELQWFTGFEQYRLLFRWSCQCVGQCRGAGRINCQSWLKNTNMCLSPRGQK